MPCRTEEFEETPRRDVHENCAKKKEMDRLTELLCSTLQAVRKAFDDDDEVKDLLPKPVLEWMVKHKKWDAISGEPWDNEGERDFMRSLIKKQFPLVGDSLSDPMLNAEVTRLKASGEWEKLLKAEQKVRGR